MRILRLFLVIVPATAFAVFGGCSSIKDPWPDKPGPKVVTSFAPIYCFAAAVAGEDASVLYVMSNIGPHEFNPSVQDALALKRADLFIINGLELDNGAARRLIQSSRNKNLKLVEAAKAIPASELRKNEEPEHHDEVEEHHHDHGKYDPHVWLGIPEAIKMVGAIRDALKEQDPAHAAGYDARAKAYIQRLEKLQAEGREMLGKNEVKILSFHDSLFYFARTFNIKIVDSIEAAPNINPDPRKLAELVKTCIDNDVRLITVEPQYDSNTTAKTLLRELRAKGRQAEFVEIDPLETARPEDLDANFYETKMRENLHNLVDKLK